MSPRDLDREIDPANCEVHAAGGVIHRSTNAGGIEVLLVHRPRYDDWSFPKGKLEPGESFIDAARREVAEETGFLVDVGVELPPVTYRDHRGRSKLVRYWSMTVVGGEFVANDEVDACAWLDPTRARQRLTHPVDTDLLDLHIGLLDRGSPRTFGR